MAIDAPNNGVPAFTFVYSWGVLSVLATLLLIFKNT